MRAHTKKHPTNELVKVVLHIHRSNVPLLKQYAETLEAETKESYTVAETFPEYIGKEAQVALRAYRHREGLTQKRLAELTGIPQHHISEMENGKRTIGKERARRLAEALHCDYRRFL
jgi:DNA-binding XRE family transcriptional regulator